MPNLLVKLVSTIIFLCVSSFCFAQKADSLHIAYKPPVNQEKIYIHYDKVNYLPGDTLRFKAYLFTGTTRSRTSTNFYLELCNDKGTIISRVIAPILESTASGSVVLPVDSNYTRLYCRAYTAAMLQNTDFVYTKELSVLNLKPIEADGENLPAIISFLPEGGDWVEGVPSLMAFKVTDAFGLPIQATGYIKFNSDTITRFSTLHDGMGAFTILPHQGQKYTAVWTSDQGKQYNTPLPEFKPAGVVLHIADVPAGKKFFVLRSAELNEENKLLTLTASSNGRVFYQSNIDFSQYEGVNGTIPTKGLPSGIISIYVSNKQHKPLAERVAFVNNHNYAFNVDTALTVNNAKRSLNQIKISVKDTLRTNFSLSVTDAELDAPLAYQDNIISHLLLTGDLRGKIVNPYYYFAEQTVPAAKALDLVMLTNGWRKYTSDTIKNLKNIVSHNYISLDGKFKGAGRSFFTDKPLVNVIVQAADSSSVLLPVNINSDGTYFKDGLIFYGDARLFFKFTDKYLKSKALNIIAKNGLLDSVKLPVPEAQILNRLPKNEAASTISSVRITNYMNRKTYMLKEVVIKDRQESDIEKLDKKLTSGLFAGGVNFKSIIISKDPNRIHYISLFQYLRAKIPGIKVYNSESVYAYATWSYDISGELPVTFYLNNWRCAPGDISMLNIEEFEYLKIYGPTEGAPFAARGAVVAVYTKMGKGVSESMDNSQSITLHGYTPVKEFYSPDYATIVNTHTQPDLRTTLYWNPNIITNKTTPEQTIKFYNNDVTRRFKIVLEGMNDDGKLIHMEKIY
jgi:hypothetical protein